MKIRNCTSNRQNVGIDLSIMGNMCSGLLFLMAFLFSFGACSLTSFDTSSSPHQAVTSKPIQTISHQEKRVRLIFHRCLETCKHFWSRCQSMVADDNIQEGIVCFQASNLCKDECRLKHKMLQEMLQQQQQQQQQQRQRQQGGIDYNFKGDRQ